jgi:hypothetical protein
MALPTFTYSGVSYAGQPAGTTTFALTTSGGKAISYLLPSHIHVYSTVDNGATFVELTRPAQWGFNPAGNAVILVTGIAVGTSIVLRRITPSDGPYTTFGQGTLLTADQLNDATLFNLYTSQETEDEADSATAAALLAVATANAATATANAATATANAASALAATKVSKAGDTMTGPLAMGTNKVTGVATPTDSADAANKTYVDNFVGQAANIADGAVTTAKIADGAVTTAKVADGAITSSKIADGTVATGDIGNLQVTGAKIADSTITSAKLTPETVVTSSELAGLSVDNASFFTTQASDSRYFRQDSSETISSGMPWSNSDSFIATTAAIDARVIDLVDDVGGFVPIANETSFPVNNPDINNPDNAGTIISIKEVVTTRTPSTGTVSIANGAGSNTVTITGCGSTVLAAGFGVLVETTGVLHTYAFHRLVPKATEVSTVASISGDVTTVANNSASVVTVAGSIANVNNVGGSIANVNAVAGNSVNVNTVAGSIANVNSVGGSIASVNTVAGNNANVTTVATNVANVNTTAGSIANVNTVAGNATNINAVAGNAVNVNTVAGISGNVTTVAGISGNITTVAGISANVTTVAGNTANINTAAAYLNAFLALYLGQAATDPALDALGAAITTGDLYFNTGSSQVRVYNGVAWQSFAENAFANTYFPNEDFGAVYTAPVGSNTIDLGSLAVTGGVFPDENSPVNRMSLALGAGSYNLGGI